MKKGIVIVRAWLLIAAFVVVSSVGLASEPKQATGGHSSEAGLSADQALSKLQEGNKRYMAFSFANKDWKAKVAEVYTGQQPYAVILSCSDSRVAPEYIFDAGLGEVFVIRNAGNLVDPIALGSIEYAAAHLGAKLLVVMGHEKCGAVTASAGHAMEHGNIPTIVEAIQPAVRAAEKSTPKDKLVEQAIVENANIMAHRILEESSVINNMVKEGKFKIVTAKYFLKDGHVEFQQGGK